MPLQSVEKALSGKYLSDRYAGDSHAPASGGVRNDKILRIGVIISIKQTTKLVIASAAWRSPELDYLRAKVF